MLSSQSQLREENCAPLKICSTAQLPSLLVQLNQLLTVHSPKQHSNQRSSYRMILFLIFPCIRHVKISNYLKGKLSQFFPNTQMSSFQLKHKISKARCHIVIHFTIPKIKWILSWPLWVNVSPLALPIQMLPFWLHP